MLLSERIRMRIREEGRKIGYEEGLDLGRKEGREIANQERLGKALADRNDDDSWFERFKIVVDLFLKERRTNAEKSAQWFARYQQAQAKGEDFDEPPPWQQHLS